MPNVSFAPSVEFPLTVLLTTVRFTVFCAASMPGPRFPVTRLPLTVLPVVPTMLMPS